MKTTQSRLWKENNHRTQPKIAKTEYFETLISNTPTPEYMMTIL